MNLFPRNDNFFDLFEQQAEKLQEASAILKEIQRNLNNSDNQWLGEFSRRLKAIEEEADDIGHNIVQGLQRSFITPLDRGDIDLLRQNLDDIMDGIEKAVNRIFIYKIPLSSLTSLNKYFLIIEQEIKEIEKGVKEVRNFQRHSQELIQHCHKMNHLEEEGDRINREALQKLLNPKQLSLTSILNIIKIKEIYDMLENVVDKCEDVGNVLESVLIKNL